MTVSEPLAVQPSIELVERLQHTVSEFASREAKLNQEFRQQSEDAHRSYHHAMAENEGRLAPELAAAESAAHAERDRLTALHARRQSRIRKALRPSKDRVLARIDEHEEGRKFEIQKTERDATRQREEGLADAESRLAEFSHTLAESRAGFASLQASARRSFRGYRAFVRMLSAPGPDADPDPSWDEYRMLEELRLSSAQTTKDLASFRGHILPRVFSFCPLGLMAALLLAGAVAIVPVLRHAGIHAFGYPHAAALLAALLAPLAVLHQLGKRKAAPAAMRIAHALAGARRMHEACEAESRTRHTREIARLETEFAETIQRVNERWHATIAEAAGIREVCLKRLDEKLARVNEHAERLHRARQERVLRVRGETIARLKEAAGARTQELAGIRDERLKKAGALLEAGLQALAEEWKKRIQPMYDRIQSGIAFAREQSPPWQPDLWERWAPPAAAKNAIKFGALAVDVPACAGGAPQDPRLVLPGPSELDVPLWLVHPREGSLLFETSGRGGEAAVAAINNVLFRLLATSPAGKLSLTIIDPVRLGQNFSGIMHLADYEENLINGRIWTQAGQIEARLHDLTEHMEKVIQMYLRNEYDTIADYNAQAGNIAEKYHVVVIADFPAGFSDTAARRLLHIAASGARCGVYTLIHWDHRFAVPADFPPEELRRSSVRVTHDGEAFQLAGRNGRGIRLALDPPPDPEFATRFLHQIGRVSRGSNRVEVPFAQVSPSPEKLWSLDTAEELRVPIGRAGAAKLQYLAIGRGTRQHALVAGKTGSGKSTLFHVIVTNLALWCGPEQVEFYLVDFKKGVEFKCYAAHRLPHARVVAIESDREFGLSVLQRVDEELRRRGDLFRRLGVQDLAGYKREGGAEPLPRSLLLIDEFQEFFVEDDRISQAAAMLLDRIVRQGRAFGIHALLGSQTLGGAYTLARTTMGQMVIRIALQCNEADAYLIMDENNAAPRLLSRPGEGIYNDAAGAVEGNSPFQIVWLPEEERDACLARLRRAADEASKAYPGPVVFEGNAPADVRDNPRLQALLDADAVRPEPLARVWLGAPNSIKGPTEAVFRRRSGNNLLIVGQRDEATLSLLSLALVSLSAQYPRGAARFVVVDATPPGTSQRDFIENVVRGIPHDIALAGSRDVAAAMSRLAADLKARTGDEHAHAPAPETFLIVHGIQGFKKLRPDDEFSLSMEAADAEGNAATQLNRLIGEGAGVGIHVLVTVDTYNNATRFLGRKALSDFEMRVLFQMSANDSASLCDDPQAASLGLHGALFHNEQEGYLEKFRPYALPSGAWMDEALRQLARLLG
jgi:DNA segregation ATPase FtsK/SpoIIIE, S-DNA-T family